MLLVNMYLKTPEMEKLFDNLGKMNSIHGRAMRISPETARTLSKCKAIRILNEKDLIDIMSKHKHGKSNSLIYLSPNLSFEKKGKKIFFNIYK